MGWGEQHAAGAGTTAQIEDAHRGLDAVGVAPAPLAVRVLAVVGVLAGIDDLTAEIADLTSRLGRLEANKPVPHWDNVMVAVTAIERAVAARGLGEESKRDQLQAYVRNTLDALNVSVTDEDAVYHGFVFAGLMVEMAKNAHGKGRVSDDALEAIADLAQSLAAALIPYVPEEVRR